jgi:hypothetical protein
VRDGGELVLLGFHLTNLGTHGRISAPCITVMAGISP